MRQAAFRKLDRPLALEQSKNRLFVRHHEVERSDAKVDRLGAVVPDVHVEDVVSVFANAIRSPPTITVREPNVDNLRQSVWQSQAASSFNPENKVNL